MAAHAVDITVYCQVGLPYTLSWCCDPCVVPNAAAFDALSIELAMIVAGGI